jgi:FO synthase subunit 2
VTDVQAVLAGASEPVRALLERALADDDLDAHEAERLYRVSDADLPALVATADHLRRRQAGDTVTYVVNRNVNFTNVCVKACKFCAFSRTRHSTEGYHLDRDEIVRRAVEAHALGATEVCIQAGLPPGMDGRTYIDLCSAVKEALPDIHVHAFSPEEVKYGAERSGTSVLEHLCELKRAGLGSLPGTSAEILDDSVRRRLAGDRITTAEWTHVIRSAHSLGIPTTSTIMFGHVESPAEVVRHLDLLRSIQRETGGFTELVPLSFVHREAPLNVKRMLPDVRAGATRGEVVRLFAVARLLLGRTFRNLQASWVKEGPEGARDLLACGANDLGGTLMNESISTAAGAPHGQCLRPADLRRLIRSAGRTPAERTTLYRIRRTFTDDPARDGQDPLDAIDDTDALFGSYRSLTAGAARVSSATSRA